MSRTDHSRRELEGCITTTLGGIVIAILAGFLWAFPLMLALGILHHNVSEAIPAFSFWETYIVAVALRSLVGVSMPTASSK